MFVAKFLGSPAINIIEGEIKEGKLLLDGKIFDKGYEGKGDVALDGQEVHALLSSGGYNKSFEDYYLAVHSPQQHQEGTETVQIPFELTIENIVKHAASHGYKGAIEELEKAITAMRMSLKKNRQVFIGIRPEAFSVEEASSAKFAVNVDYIEHIGRDISLVGKVVGPNTKVRIIISAELSDHVKPGPMKLSAKRFYVFEADGTRIK
jgi:ABC-type sugar transport system ATPase subunit